MSIRRLILTENKTIDESDKKELAEMIKENDELKEINKILEGKYKRVQKKNGELKEIIAMYENCVTDMADYISTSGVKTSEFYQDKFERKWGIIE